MVRGLISYRGEVEEWDKGFSRDVVRECCKAWMGGSSRDWTLCNAIGILKDE